MFEKIDLLQSMDESVVEAVEKYGTALHTSPEEFAALVKSCSLEEKQAIAQWLDVLNRYRSLSESGNLVDSVVNALISRGPAEDEFYQLLFKSLNDICISMSESLEELSLLVVCNIKIPYLGDKLVCLSDDRFIELSHQISEQFAELVKIYDSGYPQKTQTSSAVLSILDAIEDREQRAVLFSLWNNLLTSGGAARQLAE